MDAVAWLQLAQVVVFLGLGLTALRLWFRHRGRPAGHLAATFGLLSAIVVTARTVLDGPPVVAAAATIAITIGLIAFPLLLVTFAWSFEPPAPRWLRAVAVAVVALAAWSVVLAPMPRTGEARSLAQSVFLAAFLIVWALLPVTAAWRLWQAGDGLRLVHARMRLLSVGVLALSFAVLVIVQPQAGDPEVRWLIGTPLSVLAGILFLVGFAPPRPLRAWWRRPTTARWQRMQASLIAAVTPSEVAHVVAPVVADDLGGGVVIVGPAGRVLARAGVAADEADTVAERLAAGLPLDDRDRVVPIDRSWMVVRSSPYTPLFGADEQAMAEAYALHLRLALERAELFEAHRRALHEADRSRGELEATLEGVATSLQHPTKEIGAAAALLRDVRDAERRDRLLRAIEEQVDEAGQILTVLLDLSRIGRTHLEAEPVDLGTVIDDVGDRVAARHRGFAVEVTSPLPVVWVHPLRVSQLFDQLLRNAAEHGGRADVVASVSARRRRGGVTIEVRDDGRGYDPAHVADLFAPFWRGPSADGDGHGLGLVVVRRIVESCGGSVRARPSSDGGVFEVELPDAVVEREGAATGQR